MQSTSQPASKSDISPGKTIRLSTRCSVASRALDWRFLGIATRAPEGRDAVLDVQGFSERRDSHRMEYESINVFGPLVGNRDTDTFEESNLNRQRRGPSVNLLSRLHAYWDMRPIVLAVLIDL